MLTKREMENQDYVFVALLVVAVAAGLIILSNAIPSGDNVTGWATKHTGPKTYTCTDSDGGQNFYAQGATRQKNGSFLLDSCTPWGNDSAVVEYYCDNNSSNLVNSTIAVCLNGCSEGACLPEPVCGNGVIESGEVCDGNDFGSYSCQSLGYGEGSLVCNSVCSKILADNCSYSPNQTSYCIDSDAGNYAYTRGFITNSTIDTGDFCNGDILNEYYCGANNDVNSELINCSNGCSNGACAQVGERSIEVLYPNGGESVYNGLTVPIRWNSNKIDTVSIGYKTCPSCLSWIKTNFQNIDQYNWTVTNGQFPSNSSFKIYIVGYETGQGSVTDESDNDSFFITL